jgi:RNA polymerase sigma factor (TIGR02999 family)
MQGHDPDRAVAVEVERYVQGVVMRASQSAAASPQDLLPLIYDEMRVLAGYLLRGERVGRTLQPTALAHEAYLRIVKETRSQIRDPKHLLALSATIMRRVLIDHARARRAKKRGGGREQVSLDENLPGAGGAGFDFLDLQRVLDRLGAVDPRKVQVVEMLFFAGLTFDETAEALGLSSRTVQRDWDFARAWLLRELSRET